MDKVLQNDIKNILISNFMYSPKVMPIKHNSISFVILNAIKEAKKPEFNEVKEEFRKLSGLEVNDESFFEKTFLELRNEGYIDIQILKCTEKGIEHLKKASTKFEQLKYQVDEYFKKAILNLYKNKYHEEFNLDDAGLSEPLIERFWHCLEHMAFIKTENVKNVFSQKLLGEQKPEKCTRCYDNRESPLHKQDLDEKDYKIMQIYYSLINDLHGVKNLPPEIEDAVTVLQYSILIKAILPLNNDVRRFFEDDFKNKTFYIDTNVLVTAVARYDPRNLYIETFFRKLKKLNNGALNIFWNEETIIEFNHVLKSSKPLIKVLESYPPHLIQQIISNIALPSFVIDYFSGRWHNIESYEKYVKNRHKKLKQYCEETIKKLPKEYYNYEESLNKFINEKLLSADKTPHRLDHDVKMLATIVNLRRLSNMDKKNKLISDYWIITFDETLMKFQNSDEVKKEFKQYGNIQPVCIGESALKLLIEPYIITKSTYFSGELDALKIKESILVDLKGKKIPSFEDLCKYCGRNLEAQREIIGRYLEEANLNDFKIRS